MQRVSVIFCSIVLCLVVFGVFLAGCDSTPARLQENGSVRILSSPPAAEVYLDGEYRGTTPATVTAVTAGNHTLEVRADGYDRWLSPVTVKAGSMLNVSATLAAIPATAMPVIHATAVIPTVQRGYPEIHIDGYWTYPQGISSSTESPVPLLVHADGFNVGDADAREVTASANLYYHGREVCWKTVYLGTLKAGGHVTTDTMVSCTLPSGLNSGDLTIRFENVVVIP
jgi:PEGA domain